MNQTDSNPIQTDPAAVEKKAFWTLDRVVIYTVLAIAAVVALNDYRVRGQWESDFAELDIAVTVAETPMTLDAGNVDSTLVESIRSGDGLSNWMTDRGYEVDDSHSSETENVFFKSSGIRTFYVNVDIYPNGRVRSTYREAFYAWNVKPGVEKRDLTSKVTVGDGSPGGQERVSAGGGGGQRNGEGRSFDPEAMFTERDMDKDGFLSGDEISERMQSRVEALDEDKDGAISKNEFLASMQRFRASRQGGGGGGGGPEVGSIEFPDDPYADGAIPDPNALPEEVDQ